MNGEEEKPGLRDFVCVRVSVHKIRAREMRDSRIFSATEPKKSAKERLSERENLQLQDYPNP